jgi:hypothetical protein
MSHFDPDQICRTCFWNAFFGTVIIRLPWTVRLPPVGPSARMIVELNIRHYEQLLTRETDPSKRETIGTLLAEEKATLLALRREDKKN